MLGFGAKTTWAPVVFQTQEMDLGFLVALENHQTRGNCEKDEPAGEPMETHGNPASHMALEKTPVTRQVSEPIRCGT